MLLTLNEKVKLNFRVTNFIGNKIFTNDFKIIGPKIKNAQNLFKFETSNISSMPISILMAKIIF